MKTILTAVMAQLKNEVPDLQYIGEDWGQMDYYQDVPPVRFPCALVSISQVQYETVSKDSRRARITVQVRIADSPRVAANVSAPDSYRERAFAIFELMDTVGAILNGLEGQTFNRFKQQAVTRYNREDAIREYSMTFQTGFLLE